MKKKVGRPEKEIDWGKLDAILQYGAKLIDAAEICGVSEDTMQRRIGEVHGCTFSEYRERKMARTRVSLLQKQIQMALAGNVTLLIWTGKQHLGQTDKQEFVGEDAIVQVVVGAKEKAKQIKEEKAKEKSGTKS